MAATLRVNLHFLKGDTPFESQLAQSHRALFGQQAHSAAAEEPTSPPQKRLPVKSASRTPACPQEASVFPGKSE
jgi:hypothetical protein